MALSIWTGVSLSTLLDTKREGDLASKIAALTEREPKLYAVLLEATERVLSGQMKPEVLEDLLAYIAYRMETATNDRGKQ